MNNEDLIREMLNRWFADQNLSGMSPETTVEVAKTCLLLDVVQVFLGYDNNEMAQVDDKLRALCVKFIQDIKEV